MRITSYKINQWFLTILLLFINSILHNQNRHHRFPNCDMKASQTNKQNQLQTLDKLDQIQRLRKQVDIITLSNHLQALNFQTRCSQCQRKQQQIQTLIKAIKTLNNKININLSCSLDSRLDESQTSNPCEASVMEKQGSFCLDNASHPIENKTKTLLISESSFNKYTHSSIQQTNQIYVQLQNIRQTKQLLEKQVQYLKDRLIIYENKIYLLQESNKSLKEHIQKLKLSSNYILQSQKQSLPPPKVTQTNNNNVQQQLMKKPPLKIAKESVMKNNLSTSASNLTSPPGHNPKTGSNLTSHIASPLNNSYYQEFRSKITPSSYPPQNPSRMHEFNRQPVTCKVAFGKVINNFRPAIIQESHVNHIVLKQIKCGRRQKESAIRTRSNCSKLENQRSRSLNHKIKILQGENRKLRTDLGIYQG